MADENTAGERDEGTDKKLDEQAAAKPTEQAAQDSTADGVNEAAEPVTHPDVQAAEEVGAEPAEADPWEPPASPLPASYYTEDGVPRFDSVAERIQAQLGAEELAEGSVERQSEKAEYEQLQEAGKDRLAEIRRQMGLDN